MALTKIRIGDYFESFSQVCCISNLTGWDVSGVNREKEFFEPSTQVGTDTSKYKVVPPEYFACNLMHVGRDRVLPIAFNHTQNDKIVSPAYFVFKIKENELLLQEYFFIMLKSIERDRYFWFHTDGSIRDGMAWEDFCNLEILVPSIEVQQKYANIYNAMVVNQKAYEKGLDDLKLVCFGFIEQLRRESNLKSIGQYICCCNEKNTDGRIQLEQGINIEKQFITPQRTNSNLYGRKIVRKGQFAYCSQLNNENVAIALRKDCDCVVSSVYEVFEIIKKDELLNEYLMLWLIRPEFGRFVYWASVGSAYEFLDYNDIVNYQIPVPDIRIQQSIVDIYNQYITRKEINEKLKAQIKDLCPILIKGALSE